MCEPKQTKILIVDDERSVREASIRDATLRLRPKFIRIRREPASVPGHFSSSVGLYGRALTPDEINDVYGTDLSSTGGPVMEPPERRIVVNKTTHRIRFENETESEVTVVIEKKDVADSEPQGESQ